MTAIRYNPLTYSDNLIQSGMSERTAKVIAQQQSDFISGTINENVATKEDIKQIMIGIATIRNDINMIEYKMTIKFGMMMLAGVGVLTFFLKHI